MSHSCSATKLPHVEYKEFCIRDFWYNYSLSLMRRGEHARKDEIGNKLFLIKKKSHHESVALVLNFHRAFIKCLRLWHGNERPHIFSLEHQSPRMSLVGVNDGQWLKYQ